MSNILPDDILIETFLFHVSPVIDNIRKLSLAQTQLRLVCRRWDTLITNTPQFWSQIHIRLRRTVPKDRKPSTAALGLFAKRSSQTLLTITFELTRGDSDNIHIFLMCYTALETVIQRWHHLTIRLSSGSRSTPLYLSPLNAATSLVSVKVGLEDRCDHLAADIVRAIARAPALRHLYWKPCRLTNARLLLDIFPLHNLIEISLVWGGMVPITEVVRNCTSLQHLKINYPTTLNEWRVDILPLVLPHVRALELILTTQDLYILEKIESPNLIWIYLDIKKTPNSSEPDSTTTSQIVAPLASFISNHLHSVKCLAVGGLPLQDLISLLRDQHISRLFAVEAFYDACFIDDVRHTVIDANKWSSGGKIRIDFEEGDRILGVGWGDEVEITKQVISKLPRGYYLDVLQ